MSKKKIYWVSRDGVRNDITQMSNEYLLNVLRYVEKLSVDGVTYTRKVYISTGYDGDSYVPDHIYVTGKIFGEEVLNHLNYSKMNDELNKRII
jgi:hypothetical protein